MPKHSSNANITVIQGGASTPTPQILHNLETILQPGAEELFKAFYPDEKVSQMVTLDGSRLPGETPDEQREYLRGLMSKSVVSMRRCFYRTSSSI